MPQIPMRRGWLTKAHFPISLGLTFLLLGCGTTAHRPVAIKGKIIGSQGKSLNGAIVRFWPQEGTANQSPLAVCQADGTFSLECLPGSYKVTVAPQTPAGPAALPLPTAQSSGIPTQYQDSVQTSLRVTVSENDTEIKVLKLQ